MEEKLKDPREKQNLLEEITPNKDAEEPRYFKNNQFTCEEYEQNSMIVYGD